MSVINPSKRGPKSEKDVFLATAKTMIHKFRPELSEKELNEAALTQWEEHERQKVKVTLGKVLSPLGAKAEKCVLFAKAFGSMDTAPSTHAKTNRDLNRIAEEFGDAKEKSDGETYCGTLRVGQRRIYFNADSPLRKLADLAYTLTTNPAINIRKGSSQEQIAERFVATMLRVMSPGDGDAAQKAMVPALFAALDAFNEHLAPDDSDSDDSDEEDVDLLADSE